MGPHIAYFQSGYPGPNGITTAVHGLSLGLARRGVPVTIYGCGPRRYLDQLESHPNVQVHLFDKPSLYRFLVPRALTLRLERNEDNVDLLIINTMFNPPNVAIAKSARKGQIPYLMSPHDPYHPDLLSKNRFRKKVYGALFERPLLRASAGVQVLAAEHAVWLSQFGVKATVVVPNGFDPLQNGDALQRASGRKKMLKGDPCFLSLGRYDIHHKGLDLLLRGFAAAIRSNAVPRTAAVNMVGRGSEGADQLKKIASEEGIADHLNIVGEVSDEGRADVLRECDVMLLTSRFDGFGLVALEAMLAGKPVVVSRQAGISSWIDRARSGILAEPSVAGVRDALSQCMMVKKRWPLMGSNGRSYAHRYMSWDQVAARAAHAYTELLQLTQCPTESREGMHIIDIDSQTSECGEISECL